MAGAEDLTSASSMSAWIGANQYLDYFNSPDSILQGGVYQQFPPLGCLLVK